jgi:hypothetical protein
MKYWIILLMGISFVILDTPSLVAQEKKHRLECNPSLDVVSRFMWRGMDFGGAPHLQPTLLFTYKNIDFGFWGSYSTSTNPVQEVDLIFTWNINSRFSLTVFDYFPMDYTIPNNNYLDFGSKNTLHIQELVFSYQGPDRFPISASVATMLLGGDKVYHYTDDGSGKGQNLTTYIELGYNLQLGETSLKPFVGGTPARGYYASKPALVNTGISATREIPVTSNFSLPLTCSFIFNPYNENVFVVFGISL